MYSLSLPNHYAFRIYISCFGGQQCLTCAGAFGDAAPVFAAVGMVLSKPSYTAHINHEDVLMLPLHGTSLWVWEPAELMRCNNVMY